MEIKNFLCTTTIENILTTTPIINFCMPIIAIPNGFIEQQLLYGLLQPLQLTSYYYSC